jgi:hypothetical protein
MGHQHIGKTVTINIVHSLQAEDNDISDAALSQ